MSEIAKGYKKTEIGVIPEDWEVRKVKELIEFSGGAQPPKSTFIFTKKKEYIRLIQIRDYKNDNFITYIPEKLAKKTCDKNEIMIGRYGPPIFQILRGIEGAYNVALMKAIPKSKVTNEFLYYFLRQEKLFLFIELLSRRSSGQTGVDIVALREYPFLLPPIAEQKAIAEALSDTDSLISSLEKLIDKKKKIKEGAMQELLTGKKRLEGFSGEWEVKRLGDCFEIKAGRDLDKINFSSYKNEKFIYPVYSNAITNKGLYGYQNNYQYDENKITVTARGNLGVANYRNFKFNAIGRLIVMNPIIKCDCFFISELINYGIEFSIESTGVPQLTAPQISKYEIIIPPTKEEQTAIAQILSDMDSEISSLETKLEKYKQIKQGMMQELLTGRIRLV